MVNKKVLAAWFSSFIMVIGVAAPNLASAKKVVERPTAAQMTADALIARPVMFGATVVGTAIYAITLPVSLVGGNAEEAGKSLVVRPFKSTFVRCLGCTRKNVKNPDHYYKKNQ